MPPIVETRDRSQRLSRSRFTNITPVQQVDATLPKPVITIVTRAMEFNPAQRYQAPAEMVAELKVGHRQDERSGRWPMDRARRKAGRRRPAMVVDGGRIQAATAKLVSRAAQERRLSRAGHGRPGACVGPICRESQDGRLRAVFDQRLGRIGASMPSIAWARMPPRRPFRRCCCWASSISR